MKVFPDSRTNNYGMDLRDYFAAKALQGLIVCIDDPDTPLIHLVRTAYLYADNMMDERLKHVRD